MKRGRSVRFAAVGILVALLAACASAPPTPLDSVEPLVGKWAGTVAPEGGSQIFFYLTINPDRTLVANWGITWATGSVALANGKATYKMQPQQYEGAITYYAGPGKPTIYMQDTFASFYAVATKQQ